MFWFLKSSLPVFFSLIITYYINKNYKNLNDNKNILLISSSIWIFFFLIQYFILGENSPISYRDNGDQALSRILHDLNHHLGGKFIHNIYGGTDYYSVAGYFSGFFEFEKLIFSIFPVWIGVLIHKFMLISISFFGAYLLFTKAFKFKKLDSIFVSALLSVINPYATYQSLQHGIGFAVIYLALYIYLYTSSNKYFLIYSTILSIIISTSISPLHSFQAILGGLVLTGFIKKPENLKLSLLSILILTFFVLINWSEVLYGLSTYGELTSRIINNSNHMNFFGGIAHVANKTDYCLINCKLQFSPIVVISVIVIIASILKYKFDYLKLIIFIVICNYLPNVGWFLVDLANLNKIKSMNFYEYAYYLYIPVSILALKISHDNESYFKKIPLAFIFFAFIAVFTAKIDFVKKTFFESQNKIHLVENLKNKEWMNGKFGRTATLFPTEEFHPNFAWAHGLETSDGWQHFILKNYQFYWDYGILRKKENEGKTKYGADLYAETPGLKIKRNKKQKIFLDDHIDINLLALINNRYILSYEIIEEKKLKKISGQNKSPYKSLEVETIRDFNFYLDQLKNRLKYVKKPPNINIYEIDTSSDRVFFPKEIIKLEKNLNLNKEFKFMSNNYRKNVTFSKGENYQVGSGEILDLKKIKNGYSFNVNVDKKGILIINSFHIPYWKIFINKQEGDILNFNNIHMGIELNEGIHEIKLLYDRPLLKEKIIKWFYKL
jgi:hypothetical protein